MMYENKEKRLQLLSSSINRQRSRQPKPSEVAQYTADITMELRNLAKGAGLKTLQGLLEVTYYEAFAAANPTILPEGEIERLAQLELEGRGSEAGR
jgi:hypothetical protein